MTSPVSAIEAIEAIEKAMEDATPGVWDIWEERTPTKADAIVEMTYQVENSEPFAGAVYLLNANGKCPATTGCGPTSAANAAYIAACSPDRMREVLAAARKAEALTGIGSAHDLINDWLVESTEDLPDDTPVRIEIGNRIIIGDNLGSLRRARALLGGDNAE